MRDTLSPPSSLSGATTAEKKVMSSSGLLRINSETLLAGQKEIIIEHAGDEYRLRKTRQGKLILTK